MDGEDVKEYALSKKGTSFDFPFDADTLVIRVMNKMFALIPVGANPARVNLKCDPAYADILRQTYPAVTPGYHMNKRLWNTVLLDGTIPDDEVLAMIDHSYDQVVKGLTKAERLQLMSG